MEITTLESNALPFHFACNSVQVYNSVNCLKHLTLMSRNCKTKKVEENKLVLGAEFLSITFTFDLLLVLTVEDFFCCIASKF